METTKIRKGNDIRLKIQLKLNESEDFANIQSMRAIFVNTTLKEKFEKEFIKKNRFIGRFPIEPFVKEFEPCRYNINSTGYGIYRIFAHNEYCGFGLHPNWKKCMPIRDINVTRYFAPVISTTDPRVKMVDFPAEAQLYDGVYQLIVVAKIADAGYNAAERTVTVNYNNVFELVSDSEDATNSAVQLEINNESNVEPLQDVYVIAGGYNNGSIHLNRNDATIVDIDVSPITDWYEGD